MSLYQALHFFHSTVNWKKYWIKKISPFLGKNTVENGSGIGANINYLLSSNRIQILTCLEPNKKLFKKIKTQFNFFKKKK